MFAMAAALNVTTGGVITGGVMSDELVVGFSSIWTAAHSNNFLNLKMTLSLSRLMLTSFNATPENEKPCGGVKELHIGAAISAKSPVVHFAVFAARICAAAFFNSCGFQARDTMAIGTTIGKDRAA